MTDSEFVYVTYIAASQEKIWDAIVNPEFTRRRPPAKSGSWARWWKWIGPGDWC